MASQISIEKVREMGRQDALTACRESGESGTPDGGWDNWLVQGVGRDRTCELLGEDAEESANEWSPAMEAKLLAYHQGACQGAREWEAAPVEVEEIKEPEAAL